MLLFVGCGLCETMLSTVYTGLLADDVTRRTDHREHLVPDPALQYRQQQTNKPQNVPAFRSAESRR